MDDYASGGLTMKSESTSYPICKREIKHELLECECKVKYVNKGIQGIQSGYNNNRGLKNEKEENIDYREVITEEMIEYEQMMNTLHSDDMNPGQSKIAESESLRKSKKIKRSYEESVNSVHNHNIQYAKCPECIFICTNPQSMEAHRKVHDAYSPNMLCPCCNFKTKNANIYNSHILFHYNDRPFRCLYCNHSQYFCSFKVLQCHINTHHPKLDEVFEMYNRQSTHRTFLPKCELCYILSHTDQNSFRLHQVVHCSELPYQCLNCSFSTNSSIKFNNHYISKECGNQMCTRFLQLHAENQQSNSKILKCDKCNFVAISLTKLNDHQLERHSVNGISKCELCSFVYTCQDSLKYHEVVHETCKRRYVCPGCDYETGHVKCFNIHVRDHHEDRPYSCPMPECLDVRFNDPYLLRYHVDRFHSLQAGKFLKAETKDI